jgi:hypothetical protein
MTPIITAPRIQAFCEVSFCHDLSTPFSDGTTAVTGCIDHGIGFILPSCSKARRFCSLMVIVEAKPDQSADQALPQIVVYMACLHQSRVRQGRRNASVYRVASDGFVFRFVMLSHEGILKLSVRLDVREGQLQRILGCFKYVLEKSASTSPNVTPESKQTKCSIDETADEADDSINLDDDEDDKEDE